MSVPSEPLIVVRPLATSGALHFYWTAPASDGGSPITGYTLSCTGVASVNLGPSTYDYEYTGLTNGTSYTFSITAQNTNGSGPAATFRTVQPGGKPGPVQNLQASRAVAPDVQLSWDPPASNGGAEILGYYVSATSTDPFLPVIKKSVALPVPGASTMTTLTGLTADSVYRYSVNAVNDPGYSSTFTTSPYSLSTTWTQTILAAASNFWGGIACDISGAKVIAVTGSNAAQPAPIYRTMNGGVAWAELPATYRRWRVCASSADGTKLAASIIGGYIYTSTDSGLTWTERTGSGSYSWTSISMSDNGNTIVAVNTTGSGITISTDGGANWSVARSSGSWNTTCCSADGQILVAAGGTSAGFYISTDGGLNWVSRNPNTALVYNGVACSSYGTQIVACTTNGRIYRSIDSGANWSTVLYLPGSSDSIVFRSIASSGDGTKLFALSGISVYVSTDSGTTWAKKMTLYTRGSSTPLQQIICSRSGMQVYFTRTISSAVSGDMWVSSDAGTTWSRVSSSPTIIRTANASCCSSNGGIQYVAEAGAPRGVWTSTDGGFTWTKNTSIAGISSITSMCCSSNGAVVALVALLSGTYYVWISTDYGVTYTRNDTLGPNSWYTISCSDDGTKFAVCSINASALDSGIYISTDGGSTWSQKLSTIAFRSVACSSDMSKIVAGTYAGTSVYISIDSGVSWSSTVVYGFNRDWYTACSSDFSTIVAHANNTTGAYKSTDGGATFTLMTNGIPSSGALSLKGFSMSGDGTKMIVGNQFTSQYGEGVYISEDSGATWTQPSTLATVYSQGATTVSRDGSTYLVAPSGGGGIRINSLFS